MNSPPPPTLLLPVSAPNCIYLDFCSRVDYYDDDDYVGQRRRVEIVTTQELLERSLCCFTRRLVWPKHCCVAAKYYDFIAISLMKRPVCHAAASLKHHDHMFAIQVTLLSILQEVTEVNNLPLEFLDVNKIFFWEDLPHHQICFFLFNRQIPRLDPALEYQLPSRLTVITPQHHFLATIHTTSATLQVRDVTFFLESLKSSWKQNYLPSTNSSNSRCTRRKLQDATLGVIVLGQGKQLLD